MKRLRIFAYILVVISMIMILTGILLLIRNNIEREYCLNLRINDFYNNNECIEILEDYD